MKAVTPIPVDIPKDAITSRISIDSNGCWVWQRGKTGMGYGQVTYSKRTYAAHRTAYTIFKGPIPDGLTIDHLCRNKACVNPSHLEAVSLRENCLRGTSPAAVHIRKTHCVRGHEFTEENIRLRNGSWRVCRECVKVYSEQYREIKAIRRRERRIAQRKAAVMV